MRRRPILVFSCIAAAGALGICAAQAQAAKTADSTAADHTSTDHSSVGELQEITVTAQRRRQNLQDVPIAVSVVTAADAAKLGAVDTTTLDTEIPTLQASRETTGMTLYLRGVGTVASPGVENAVAMYVDGVYVNGFSGGIVSFNNIKRIEVLEGPQGTLFGRNATGGVIRIITKDPSFTPALNLQVGYGNYDTYTTDLYGTTGITSHLAANIAVESRNQNSGYGRDLTTGQPINLGGEYGVRTKWKWTPSSATSIMAELDYYHENYDYGLNQTVVPGTLSAGDGTFRGYYNSEGNNPYSPGGPGANGHQLKVDGQSVIIVHHFGWATLKSITARRHTSDYVSFDEDGGPLHYNDARWPYSLAQYTEEVHLASPAGARLWGRKLRWLAGVFYLNSRDYTDLMTSGALLGGGLLYSGKSTSFTHSYSGFFDGTLDLVPGTSLTLGARETADRITNESSAYFVAGNGAAFLTQEPTGHADATRTTWRAILDHKFDPAEMGYLSVSTGFKSGGFNLFAPGAAPTRPEQITAYELGLKSQWLNRRLQANAEAYYYDYRNQQVQVIESGAAFDVNAAASHIYGLDLKVEAAPLDNLLLFGNLGYLHGRYLSFPGAPVYLQSPATCTPTPHRLPGPLVPGDTQCSFDAAGNPTIRSPEWSGNVGFDYKAAKTPSGALDLTANYYYTSTFNWDPSGQFPEPPYGLLSTSVIWTLPGGKYDVQLYCTNCLNKYHDLYIAEAGPSEELAPSDPRLYGIKIGAHF